LPAVEDIGEGIAFAFGQIERTPDTLASHQSIELAQQAELSPE
jgi:predicted DsbA family dithiol-disulfide isomerase